MTTNALEEKAARRLLATNATYDPATVRLVLGHIAERPDAHAVATSVVDLAIAIWNAEIRPLVDIDHEDPDTCYGGRSCAPTGRCSFDFSHGVTVEHALWGNRWLVEGGGDFASRRLAEVAARRSVLLRRLRADLDKGKRKR